MEVFGTWNVEAIEQEIGTHDYSLSDILSAARAPYSNCRNQFGCRDPPTFISLINVSIGYAQI